MVKVRYETGKVLEIESGFVHGKVYYHSHVLLKRDDGEVVRLEDVAVEDYINGAVKVGQSCTIAFIDRKGRAPRPYESQIVRNAIVGVAASGGYVIMNVPEQNYYLYLSFGISGLGALLIMMTRNSDHPTAWLFIGLLMIVMFGLVGLANLNTVRNANGARDEIIRKFESLGSRPQAPAIFG